MASTLNSTIPLDLAHLAGQLIKNLPDAKVYLVGGAVRDLLLNRPTKDFDLVVCGIQPDKLEKWLAKNGQVNLVGKTFGVFKWVPKGWEGETIDVALPRTEHTEVGTGQYRDFAVQSDPALTIEEDLLRRDFTVNAMALNLKNNELVDPTNGQADLENKTLRAVGEPNERFKEDLSRVLRGIRFACSLGFEIEKLTWEATKLEIPRACNGKINDNWLVPREVIARELLKTLAVNPSFALEMFDKAGVLNELLPEVTAMKDVPQPPEFHTEGDVFQHTKLALEALSSPAWQEFFGTAKPSLNTIVAILLHDIGKPLTIKTPELDGTDRIRTDNHDTTGAELVSAICSRLKLTSYTNDELGSVEPEKISWLVAKHMLLVHGVPEEFKPSTIYRYFWKDKTLGLALQQLLFADSYSTKPKDGRDLTESLIRLRKRIDEVSEVLDTNEQLQLFLTGNDIMKLYKLTPGPKIGGLLTLLEEAQLEGRVKTRDEAEQYLQKHL